MLETIRNAWKIPDLRRRILFTLFMLIVFRFGAHIPVPFLSKEAMQQFLAGGGGGIGLGDLGLGPALQAHSDRHETVLLCNVDRPLLYYIRREKSSLSALLRRFLLRREHPALRRRRLPALRPQRRPGGDESLRLPVRDRRRRGGLAPGERALSGRARRRRPHGH